MKHCIHEHTQDNRPQFYAKLDASRGGFMNRHRRWRNAARHAIIISFFKAVGELLLIAGFVICFLLLVIGIFGADA